MPAPNYGSMADYRQQQGLGYTPAYQTSAIPYCSGSIVVPALGETPVRIVFPLVTRFLTVKNIMTSGSDAPLRVGFSALGVAGTNYFELRDGKEYTAEFRVKEIYMVSNKAGTTSAASVIAGCTTINSQYLENNWSGSEGVG